ncbi:MAG: hypothetical protein PHV02_03165 [Rhodocyclaceae bacterium]|nr:hypothetical protein [Rhodocyclaceae bacterium]
MSALQIKFEAWAHRNGFDLSKHEAGTYKSAKTVAAMLGYFAGASGK